MPRLTDEVRAQRRRHVLTSAWSCFSRDGFHATSMDQIIAATGMSSSAVYGYFRSKDDLIDATVDEALGQLGELFAALLNTSPAPTPYEVFDALVGNIRSRMRNPDYDLSQLAMQAWVEALRRPHLAKRVAEFYRLVREHLYGLAQRWQEAGQLGPDADAASVAALLATLMPGMIVSEQLVDRVSPDQLIAGMAGLAGQRRDPA
ncbi:MAG TPA: TetR/AcrR family transcriptional regulator [Pseudonocardiaceae bacterium]|nr:TetR/AcrR family transcriptional regulator [Pseudonocardiaceae bacterium]